MLKLNYLYYYCIDILQYFKYYIIYYYKKLIVILFIIMKSLIMPFKQNLYKLFKTISLHYLHYECQSLFVLPLHLYLWIHLFRPIYHICRSTNRELSSCKPRIGRASINVRKSRFHFRRERRKPFAAPRTQLLGCQSIRLVTPFTIGCANDF